MRPVKDKTENKIVHDTENNRQTPHVADELFVLA